MVISEALAASPGPGPTTSARAHSVRGMATSVAFSRNCSVKAVMESSCWRSASVFTSFYLKDVQFSYQGGFGLGPFVAANAVIQ